MIEFSKGTKIQMCPICGAFMMYGKSTPDIKCDHVYFVSSWNSSLEEHIYRMELKGEYEHLIKGISARFVVDKDSPIAGELP